ncbi:MAG: hypothetical protein OEY81_00400 [Candidatus Bathyarchaeota archaeon]|nr:hypothetical protein [Candidatus Bathyarchaeota archaeon]
MKTETTEELKPQSNEEEVAKIMVDRPSDFRFHAAYLAYSEMWDKTASQGVKTELNEIMSSLSNKEISYSSFYNRLGNIGSIVSTYYARKRIETQRKREWRKRRARDERNARHRRRH